ncbi:uncharacterized protein [Fopius arisanus]|uniref:Uncharacterized protein n=1 Tax=Fopius arisanus TaxID=64838 RepID=A0A9R1U820_9HYME|nr:PREDICTED: uncharacterized protein LOC105271795 [Fopius arisanus]
MSIMKEYDEESSSSDDEMTRALKEATDSQFLTESLFDKKTKEKEVTSVEDNYVEKYDEFGVSEGFKDYMAKKLIELLDRNIQMEDEITGSKSSRKRKKIKHEKSESGVKLLRSSKNILKGHDMTSNEYEILDKPRKQTTTNFTSRDNLLKCQESAVDPQFVLSKVETEFWSDRKKGIVYEYKKLPDGTLIEK